MTVGLGRWFAARCDSVGAESPPARGALAFTVRADERGPGLCVFSGAADLARWWLFSLTGAHVGYEPWVERDALMALDADSGVEAGSGW